MDGACRVPSKEGLISQDQNTPREWRTKMPAQCPAFRRLGRAAVLVAALLLVGLTWLGARDAIWEHRSEARARVRAELLSSAVTFEEQLRRELLSIDQTLRILEYEWQRDAAHFDLAARAAQVVVVNDVALQLFVADDHGIVRLSTRPAIVGTDVTQRDYFRYEAALPTDDGKMFVGELTQGQITRLWQINLVRRLDDQAGHFSGVIAASYDTNAFVRLSHDVALGNGVGRGTNGIIGVVSERDGEAWTMSDATRTPGVADINSTPLFAAMRAADEGNWQGPSALSDVDRMYAFATVPDRGLKVIVGVDREAAMRESFAWEQDALIFAAATSLLLGLLAWLLLRALDAARQRHEALAHERSILEATLTGMSDGIMMVDADLRLMAWNQHFPQFTGVPPEILRVGLPMEDILRSQVAGGEFGPVDAEAEVARRLSLIRSGASMGTTERSRPGGRQLEIRRNPLPGGGFVTLYRDVTARREAEERLRQAQTMAAIGRLTAGVAHDFNNLLISISGNAEMLHDHLQGEPVHARRLAVILQSAGRGADLVRRLLAFARKQSLTPTQVDLNKLVRGMGDLLRATLGRAVRVETKLDDTLWSALVDPIQVEHVILNLAINARDAMPDGGTLTISTANTSLGPNASIAVDLPIGDYVIVAVSDTGTGMSEEVLRNAFEPFFTTKPIGEGSGLGLSQVYGVANQSGGGVRIDSSIGAGTTVSVLFPRAPDDVAERSVSPSGLEQAAGAMVPPVAPEPRNRTILVVDDEPECREMIAASLSANGFTVILAENGEAALRLLDEGAVFDLLLVDYDMPGMNGAALAQVARTRRLAVPVVFVTGDGECINGERWVLTKPFLTRNLIATLHTALGLVQEDDAVRQATSQAM